MVGGKYDVAIVGAGSAGAAAAALCANRGLRVVCVDRKPLTLAGACWVNGVPARLFDEAGLERSRGEERRGHNHTFHLVAGYPQPGHKQVRATATGHGILDVDMRFLVQRLRGQALDRGAVFEGDIRIDGFDGKTLRTSGGKIAADVFVDASGLAGANLMATPRIEAKDLCAAAQQVHEVVDHRAAAAFFAGHDARINETLCFAGVEGGFSIINVRYDGDVLSILTGSIVDRPERRSGKRILDDFVAGQRWIGRALFGGARAVPLRRSFDQLTCGRVAILGDAASQVFSAHGSGVGVGLVAARALADALASGQGLDDYAVRWHRRYGPLLAIYDLVRRLSQTFTVPEIERLIRKGVVGPGSVTAALAQTMPPSALLSVALMIKGFATEPSLTRRIGQTATRAALAAALYARYPRRQQSRHQWSRRIAAVFGDRPDHDCTR